MLKVLIAAATLMVAATSFGQSIKKSNTLMFHGAFTPGFGELNLRSQKMLDKKTYAVGGKAAWQIARIADYVSLTVGYGGAGARSAEKGDDAPKKMTAYHHGPMAELILFPASIVHGSIAGLWGRGKLRYQATDESPAVSTTTRVVDTSASILVKLTAQTRLVLTAGRQSVDYVNEVPALGGTKSEDETTFSLGVRGTLL